MDVGLLWFDDDPGRDLAQKVRRAASRYRHKFGRQPTVCYVHPSTLDGEPLRVGQVQVAALPSVLRDHFWIGEEDGRGDHGRLATSRLGRVEAAGGEMSPERARQFLAEAGEVLE